MHTRLELIQYLITAKADLAILIGAGPPPPLGIRASRWAVLLKSRALVCVLVAISGHTHTHQTASLGGLTMGQIGWGGPSTGPALFLVQQGCLRVGVSRCGPATVVGRGC